MMKTTFEISLSREHYEDKNKIDYSTLTFERKDITPNELISFIKEGFSFMAVLNDYQIKTYTNTAGKEIKYQNRKANDIKQTNIICVDVDDSTLAFSDYISTISLKPTFAYTTPNDGILGNRFRLVYILNKPITEQSEFATFYNGIISTLNKETNTINNDDCGNKIERLFNGNAKENIKTFESGIVYDLKDIPTSEITQQNKPHRRRANENISNIVRDFKEKDLDDFISLYLTRVFIPIEKTKRYYNAEGYAILTKNDWEIKRMVKDMETGKYKHLIADKRKLKIGEDRKKYLFRILQLKRKIKPNVTFDELLFNAAFELCKYIWNSDKKITKDYLLQVVENVINSDCNIEPFENKKGFEVNKKYCNEKGIKPNQYKMIVRKRLNFENISKWYDVSKSVKENLTFSKENNIKVGKDTLYRFCKENGINTKGEPKKEPTNKTQKSTQKGRKIENDTNRQNTKKRATESTKTPLFVRNWEPANEQRNKCKLYQLFAKQRNKIIYQYAT